MCGITGIINFNGAPVSLEILKKMTEAIAHRGPDGEGHWIENNAGLGHRRLAIIDLSPAGHQPMMTEDGRFAITYNGEIYNYRELRSELEDLGYSFFSQSDTEVVLKSFVQWGDACLERFNGMFAFAIWDSFEKGLFLARDRYGVKPLYYGFFGDHFLFGSEQKAILMHPSVKREIDLEALVEYFTFQNIFTDRTFMRDIKLFPAGSFGVLSLKPSQTVTRHKLKISRYWAFDFREPSEKNSESDYHEELDRLFRQAVQRQLVSDVPVGAYLSGGIDSGSITRVASSMLPAMPTFTCGFDLHSVSGLELSFDERERAEHMSFLFGTEHYEVVLKAGDMERVLPQLVDHLEDPRVGQCYPNFYIARLASKFVKVVLSGTGGDELFGGYPWRYYRGVHSACLENYIDHYYSFWQRLIPEDILPVFFAPIWKDIQHFDPKTIFRDVINGCGPETCAPEDLINLSLTFEAKTFLHGLLMVEDKLSMAHGLETRVPFLDNDLVDFAMRLPVNMKIKNMENVVRLDENESGPKSYKYFQRTGDGKYLLRNVLGTYTPDMVTLADKQGFSAPDASWFRGKSIDYVRSALFNGKATIYEYLDRKTAEQLTNDHFEGLANRRLLIWSLLSVECYLKQLNA